MTDREILQKVDHTLLKADATWGQIKALCDEAVEYETASICINGGYVKQAAEYLAGRMAVCTVIGFPLGAMATAAKVFEAKAAIADGAAEVDMVINIGRMKNGEYAFVQEEIRQIKEAIGPNILKVIVETCLLTEAEKEKACELVVAAGADFIKTSTGFSVAGATFEDVELFARFTKGGCKIKAAGGIKTRSDMEKFIALGATRLGTSSAIKILNAEKHDGY